MKIEIFVDSLVCPWNPRVKPPKPWLRITALVIRIPQIENR